MESLRKTKCDEMYTRGYLHEVSFREVDAKVLSGQKTSREPSEKCHDENVLNEAVPESSRIELAAVGGGGRLVCRNRTKTTGFFSYNQSNDYLFCQFFTEEIIDDSTSCAMNAPYA